jgi:GTPase
MSHKSGFVNILGAPNAGKSTLMNALAGEKLSIITPKVQTTRHRVKGIVSGDDFQIVFTDTPGIIDPKYMLQQSMMKFLGNSLADGDVFLFLVEPRQHEIREEIIQKILKRKKPLILLINKIDLSEQALVEADIKRLGTMFPGADVMPVSALHRFNIDGLMQKILEYLPESEPFFPKEELTDRPERFFVAEIIREKIFLLYEKEIPYSTEVEIESFAEEPEITRITAIIHVMRESQKAIILGHKGAAIKRTGIQARKDIEAFLSTHVYLELRVKVSKDWRDNEKTLKRFGYEI